MPTSGGGDVVWWLAVVFDAIFIRKSMCNRGRDEKKYPERNYRNSI